MKKKNHKTSHFYFHNSGIPYAEYASAYWPRADLLHPICNIATQPFLYQPNIFSHFTCRWLHNICIGVGDLLEETDGDVPQDHGTITLSKKMPTARAEQHGMKGWQQKFHHSLIHQWIMITLFR